MTSALCMRIWKNSKIGKGCHFGQDCQNFVHVPGCFIGYSWSCKVTVEVRHCFNELLLCEVYCASYYQVVPELLLLLTQACNMRFLAATHHRCPAMIISH